MAIYHCSMKPIARSGGRSSVAAVAYRTASLIVNQRDGLVHDFTRKRGVEHTEIVLPDGVEAAWALDRSTLWNAVEQAEKRRDARVAREFELALPHELDAKDRLLLVRDFARELANRYGAAIDFAIHQPHTEGDVRNVHAHVLMTTRTVGPDGLGEKTLIERENKWLLNHNQPTSHIQLRDIRQAWEISANRYLVRAGLDVRIDHRSHQERGLEIEPTGHMGVFASQMDRRGLEVSRTRLDEKAARRNAELIRDKPEEVLSIITGEKSVFDRHDVARALHRYIDDVRGFQNAFAAVMASSALVELQPERDDALARYSTFEMIEVEHAMAASASRMGAARGHGVDRDNVDRALNLQDGAIRTRTAASITAEVEPGKDAPGALERSERIQIGQARAAQKAGLSDEQRLAIAHITGPEQIAAVIGFAGAGKSTMLAAARDAWERQGYRVHGAALAGKAAAGLEESSGIASRTLASLEYGWQAGRGHLGRGDVLVIDEAGMVGSRQLARFVMEAEARGAKLVLVGDHEQLQAIGAGSPFRAIAERVGAVELSQIRRQREGWQREASVAFATHRTDEGLASYEQRGRVSFAETRDQAKSDLVRDYLSDLQEQPAGSRIALAHRRVDVRAINAGIRASLQDSGRLARGEEQQGTLGRERVYQTNDGKRSFAPGDRIVLLENNRDLGVKNGMLGTVHSVESHALQVRLDGAGQNTARVVTIPVNSYQAFDHGYATTIHKSQGATVDRAFVLASGTMDRHLSYVAMTRHRDQVKLYAGRDEMKDMKVLSASMSRSGAKETTLDYTGIFTERRGLAEGFGVRSEIAIGVSAGQAAGRLPERAGVQREGQAQGHEAAVEIVQPLVPAITRYSRSIEEVAREKARPDLVWALEAVRSVGRHVYADADGVAGKLGAAIMDKGTDAQVLAKAVAERPEQFGELRGKTSLLGDNKERKAARHHAKALSNHVASAGRTWERRLEAERQSESWQREKRDGIKVPGMTSRSEAILKQLDNLPRVEKTAFLEQLSATAEGKQALDEAKTIANALEQRFGRADPRDLSTQRLRLGPEVSANLERIKHVARLADRTQRAELSRQYELKRTLNKGLGLGM